MGDRITLTFHPGGKASAVHGETVLNVAWMHGFHVPSPCGGQGICGRCRVRIEPSPPPSPEDRASLTESELGEGWRLACRSAASGGSRITLERSRPGAAAVPPLFGAVIARAMAKEEPGAGDRFGVAVDMGTTTLAGQVWDLRSHLPLGSLTAANPQAAYGADVISRVSACGPGGAGLPRLRDLLREGVEGLVMKLLSRHGVKRGGLVGVTVAGNTVMQHFFSGENPSPLARAPFAPPFLAHPPRKAEQLGLRRLGKTTVRFVPCASAFVGGDAVAGVTALLAMEKRAPSLLIDMGTNAELVLIRDRSFLSTSAAAGPALEGGSIGSGMAAVPGAVEEVDFDGDLRCRVIGGGPPEGLCGSGLLDLVSLLLRFGLLLPDGRLLDREETSRHPWRKLGSRLGREGEVPFFHVADGREGKRPVRITQEDLRQLQLAKSAIATAWQILLRESRLGAEQIDTVYLAGGFGYSLRPSSLADIGLIHPLWKERTSVLGNASLAGASLCLVDDPSADLALRISRRIRTFQLAEKRSFGDIFVRNLSFPDNL